VGSKTFLTCLPSIAKEQSADQGFGATVVTNFPCAETRPTDSFGVWSGPSRSGSRDEPCRDEGAGASNNAKGHFGTRVELLEFGRQHYASILWGAWLQAVRPVFIMLFAFSIAHLAGATQRPAGWITLFGATILMTVRLVEITYYISALFPEPEAMTSNSLRVISAVQHLYFIVGGPRGIFATGYYPHDLSTPP